jgi:curli biogenesis system outer membrane secretion channel CsgG
MAGLLGKLTAYARTPAGQRVIRTAAQKAQQLAKDPKTRAKVSEFRQRAGRRGQTPPSS